MHQSEGTVESLLSAQVNIVSVYSTQFIDPPNLLLGHNSAFFYYKVCFDSHVIFTHLNGHGSLCFFHFILQSSSNIAKESINVQPPSKAASPNSEGDKSLNVPNVSGDG